MVIAPKRTPTKVTNMPIRHGPSYGHQVKAISESSVFECAWKRLDTLNVGHLELYKIHDLIKMIEIELLGENAPEPVLSVPLKEVLENPNEQQPLGFTTKQDRDPQFLSADRSISARTNSVIKDIEQQFGHFSNELSVSKLDMLRLVETVLSDIKIFDYNSMKVYGTFENYGSNPRYFQDNYNMIMEVNNDGNVSTPPLKTNSLNKPFAQDGAPNINYDPIGSLVTQVDELLELCDAQTSEDEDFDETASLMGTSVSGGSPSTLFDVETESLGDMGKPINKQISLDFDSELEFSDKGEKFTGFQLKKSLEDLQQFHNDLEGRFQTYENELNQLSYRNNSDFKHLIHLNKNNNRMIERIGSLRSEILNISCQLQEIKVPGSVKEIESSRDTPTCNVDVRSTELSEEDKEIMKKLTPQGKDPVQTGNFTNTNTREEPIVPKVLVDSSSQTIEAKNNIESSIRTPPSSGENKATQTLTVPAPQNTFSMTYLVLVLGILIALWSYVTNH